MYFQNICQEGETFEDPFDSDSDDDDVTNDTDGDGKSYYQCDKNTATGRFRLVRKECKGEEVFIGGKCTSINPEETQGNKARILLRFKSG